MVLSGVRVELWEENSVGGGVEDGGAEAGVAWEGKAWGI